MQPSPVRQLFRGMLRIRLVEEAIAELYAEQEMRCPVHLCIGQEAVATGVCAHLGRRDRVMSGHRSHGHYLAKGGSLREMVAEMYGRSTGCCGGKGGSMHLIDLPVGFWGATPIVASTIPIAVGLAFAASLRREDCVTVTFFGEGATEEGTFHEAVNFAATKKLPIVFVCENNLYSVYSPLSVRQPAGREVFWLARGHGIPAEQGDGNDVLEVFERAGEAIRRTREGQGPCFLEFKTYRWREHCGPNFDNHIGYRTEQEYLEWRKDCPIERLKAHALAEGTLLEAEMEAMSNEIKAEVTDAVRFARESPFPAQEQLLDGVCAAA
jgi:TPP-dependent pyruvate/acetoin dehydrogenase alpha subunit